jgi:hypothetical protein
MCNPNTGAEAGVLVVPGQPGLHSKTLPQKPKSKSNNRVCRVGV